ncbi:MAG TPA: hypothetical protein VFX78_11390 [Candidatus Eisenbacteria bacterium]|nr:hypothetical protein [Candidatus Eisenbacteria bacterium]
MTHAAQHPAVVAAVEALRPVLREVTSRYGQSYREPDYNPAAHLEITITVDEARKARAALALLRAAMSKAETAWLMRHNKGGTWPVLMDEDDGDSVRVTVLRWEE